MVIEKISHYNAELTEEERCTILKCANLLTKIINNMEEENCNLILCERPYKIYSTEECSKNLNCVDLENIKRKLETLVTLTGITKN